MVVTVVVAIRQAAVCPREREAGCVGVADWPLEACWVFFTRTQGV